MEAAAATPAPHVLVIPFPAQGHALPLLDLTALLAVRGLRLTVVTTPGNLPLLSPRTPPPSPPSPSRSPPTRPSHRAREHQGLRPGAVPGLHPRVRRAPRAGPRVGEVAIRPRRGRHRRLLLRMGADARRRSRHPWVRLLAVRRPRHRRPSLDVPSPGQRPAGSDDEEFRIKFPALPGEPEFQWRENLLMYRNYMEGRLDEQIGESIRQNFLWNLESSRGFVSNTLRALEGRYLDTPLEDLGFRRVWAVGPVAPETDASGARGGEAAVAVADLSSWLDAFPEGSVVYISFGSQAVLTPAVAAALAEALERSAVPFVWVVGAVNGGVVPEGFEARAAAAARRGMVVRGWAPQVAALRHAAVGWFVTHCGWNSTMEAVAAGVPMLAWPMTGDQFVNARLLVDEARVAVRACAGGVGVAPDAGELAAVLADAVGEKGRDVAAHAKELAAEAARAVKEGGSSYADLEGFVKEIQKLS
ncbi:hypothetical protein EJB05_39934, partial [Eragrostis curvula]